MIAKLYIPFLHGTPAKMGDVNIIGIEAGKTRNFVIYMYVEKDA